MSVDGVLRHFILRTAVLNHIAVGTARASDGLEEVLEHFGEETFERCEPIKN
ncbi:MAG: hypothetical protein II559_06870 [Muribaculaceae bacterium]|nr:hypothetical protein [Muribaculaceae bacterium]MBQ2563118.1 hypothetical protein [Muribaculaceae bacterium]